MLLNLTEFCNYPIHLQIARQVLERIVRGELAPGHTLPSWRRLARDHHLGGATVRHAFRELESLGVITPSPQDGKMTYKVAPPISAKRTRELFRSLGPGHEDERYRRLESELKKAGQIQKALLPATLSVHSDLQLAGFCHPSLMVGGDFFDVLPLGPDSLALVVADACGKGMPAALLGAQIQAILKVEAHRGSSIGDMIAVLNDYLQEFTSSDNFATLFYAQFDLGRGLLRYVNAGHNPAVLQKADGRLGLLKATGLPLGIFAGSVHKVVDLAMEEGDCLMVYSDGLTEARNPGGEEFGLSRLSQALAENRGEPALEIVESIKSRLESFHQAGWWQDDRTLLVLRRLPAQKQPWEAHPCGDVHNGAKRQAGLPGNLLQKETWEAPCS